MHGDCLAINQRPLVPFNYMKFIIIMIDISFQLLLRVRSKTAQQMNLATQAAHNCRLDGRKNAVVQLNGWWHFKSSVFLGLIYCLVIRYSVRLTCCLAEAFTFSHLWFSSLFHQRYAFINIPVFVWLYVLQEWCIMLLVWIDNDQ